MEKANNFFSNLYDSLDDISKNALTELFNETKSNFTPKMVEGIVNDIDEIVRIVRFEGWQWTIAGEREVTKALRKTLLKYKLHKEQELFNRAYNYIREYYYSTYHVNYFLYKKFSILM